MSGWRRPLKTAPILQIGLGTIPEAVPAALKNHRDLGIHSGLLSDGFAELIERGVVTNARKGIDRGTTVAGLVAGGPNLMKLVDRNPAISLRSTDYTTPRRFSHGSTASPRSIPPSRST